MGAAGAARAEAIEEIKKRTGALGLTFDNETFSNSEIRDSLSCELERISRHLPDTERLYLKRKAELYVDRINDLESESEEQRITSVQYLGEQGFLTHVDILREIAERNASLQVKFAIRRSIKRIKARLHQLLREPNFTESELKGEFHPYRRPWRALVRVTYIEDATLRVVLPGRDSEREIEINCAVLPEGIQKNLYVDKRFFARINLGAERDSELYFTQFEETP